MVFRVFSCSFLAALLLLSGCAQQTVNPYLPQPYVQVKHPEWSKNAVLYQINTRQFTPEGTLKAAQAHLPRLKAFGVDILWLMPIHPIGEVNRKGSLGSPYAVKDYFAVNPEFGTLEDLKAFVDAAHAQGMYVILDWVANHTAWDNPIHEQHPEWYERDHNGNFHPTPWWDWDDIIDLNFNNAELRAYMTSAMRYWVEEVGIDGYRCDVAGFVPVDFWNNVRRELDAIKPVFMLAEWESRDLHAHAFDATYAWSWRQYMHEIAHGKADVGKMFLYYSWNESAFPANAYRMTHISNHDTNSWEGTQFEAFGDALPAAITLSFIGDGLPLIYNGQEAGNPKRLKFFERDPIEWREHPIGDLYKQLIRVKKANTVLWNGAYGALMVKVPNSQPSQVLSFVRRNDTNKVFAVFNLSPTAHEVSFKDTLFPGDYRDAFSEENVSFTSASTLKLAAWESRVFVQNK